MTQSDKVRELMHQALVGASRAASRPLSAEGEEMFKAFQKFQKSGGTLEQWKKLCEDAEEERLRALIDRARKK